MQTFNFSANGADFGDYTAETEEQAQDLFAQDAGYLSWEDLGERCGTEDITVSRVE